jgi:DNA-binding transcriptional ArsR family regulator
MNLTALGDDALWTAIAEPSRRRLIDALSKRGELSASMLASGMTISRQAITKHLAVLEKASLVNQRKQGKEVLFTIRPDKLQEASLVMREASARWDQRLQRIKAIAEQLENNV